MTALDRKKIHHVFNSTLVSGPETLVMPNLIEHTANVEIVLIQESRLPEGAKKVEDYVASLGFRYHIVNVHSQFDWKTGKALSELWNRTQPDLIHAHGQKASFYTLMAVKWPFSKINAKLVSTNHAVRSNYITKKLQTYESVYQRLVMPFFDRNLVVCSTDAHLLIQNRVPARSVAVHLNGVDRKKIAHSDRARAQREVRALWEKETGRKFDGICFGVVARLSKEKRFDRILQAFSQVRRERPDLPIRLVCMGSGMMANELKKMSADLEISDRVHWLGYRSQAAYEMVGFDALLSWSDTEGLPINLVEAGWVGTPVIVHGVDGVNDLVNVESGYLLESPMTVDAGKQALIDCAIDAEKRDRFGIAFQKRVEELFSKKTWVKRLAEIYDQLF